MNDVFYALESWLVYLSDHSIFIIIPLMFFTFHLSVSFYKILVHPRLSFMSERLSVPAVSDKKEYISPVLHLHPCPVSDVCSDCRFYNTDSCLRGYLG